MAKVKEIRDFFNEKAPFYTKLDFDNVGMLVGYCEKEVSKVLVALDITDEVISEAIQNDVELIVSHHPLLFTAIKRVTDDDDKGRKIISLLTHGISAICLHTNLDTAAGGVNDALMDTLGATVDGLLDPHGTHPDGCPYGISRIGHLSAPTEFQAFLKNVKENLHSNGLRYHYAGHPVYKIACCGGAGGGDLQKAFNAGCDTYVTADLKYDHFLCAKELGINLIDADHFCTENVVVPVLANLLRTKYPSLEILVSEVHGQTAQFF